ncbi:hypothetical protein GCM10010174_57470 [Kutzneria viridogrisea]|uniref:Secreted protein n=2 Tax=Kutzneria TaxID=43356 RepID=A0ABR6BL76_9PSEU|nr:hypothetical protein [Kutzneria albida]AHH94986.1 putative secreted protein [Kutzneria albida DSM 43870]MBA8927658.1 hypothetical protein [Kutzneria viridogrisea]
MNALSRGTRTLLVGGLLATSMVCAVQGTATAATDSLFRSDGYGPIYVGMSQESALATGKLTNGVNTEDCGSYRWVYGAADWVTISKTYGVYQVPAPKGTHTKEGVRVGTSAADLQGLYPAGSFGTRNNHAFFSTVTPQNARNRFDFGIADGKVTSLSVRSVEAYDCAAG